MACISVQHARSAVFIDPSAPARSSSARRQSAKPRNPHLLSSARTLVSTAAVAGTETSRSGPGKPPAEEKIAVESVGVYDLAPDVKVVRGTCRDKLRSEVEYMLRPGTSDNSYIITVPGAVALIDVPYEAYAEPFVGALKQATPLGSLTHIVITHLDPKAIPTLELVLAGVASSGTKPTLVLSNPALRLLQSTLGEQPEKAALLSAVNQSVARSGQSITLGSEPSKQLRLELTPTPRWPDMLVAYYPPARLLFSSKLFSAHVAQPTGQLEDVGGWERFAEDWRYFFDCMLAPSARQALLALDKLDLLPVPLSGGGAAAASSSTNASIRRLVQPLREEFAWLRVLLGGRSAPPAASPLSAAAAGVAPPDQLQVSMLAPLHGPTVTSALAQLLREYRSWVQEQIQAADTANVVVLYASAYGNTAALAQAISRGITKSGVGVTTLNLEVCSLEDVTAAIKQSDGFVIGSPTLGGHMPTQVSVALGAIMREKKAQTMPCGVFGSFGWSGEAVDEMKGRLKDAGFAFAFPAIRVKFKPTAKDLLQCEDSGRDLAQAIKRKARGREAALAPGRAATVASGAQLAAGRIVGSLSVLTAKVEDASTAMLASWVSQASFEPPGLTVAVKKDRAMEPLLQIGNRFCVSMVPEGKDRAVMKRLARAFKPDEDRLAGLETSPGPITGAAVLKDSHAYMECQVVSRMEAGDHYVLYATVLDGAVTEETEVTAVHHRKVANHY